MCGTPVRQVVSDKQYTEIEARDYQPPLPPVAGDLGDVEDSEEYSSSDVDVEGGGGGSSEYDAGPETTRSTQNTPVLQLDAGGQRKYNTS